jgi:hypothetical protein
VPIATTTYTSIRDNLIDVIEALTPATQASHGYRRAHRVRSLRSAAGASGRGSSVLRRFEVRRGAADEPEAQDPAAYLRVEDFTISVAYPVAPGLYGNEDLDAVEGVIRADARQIRDAVVSAGNYVAGQQGVECASLPSPDTSADDVYYQDLTFRVSYYEAQSLV